MFKKKKTTKENHPWQYFGQKLIPTPKANNPWNSATLCFEMLPVDFYCSHLPRNACSVGATATTFLVHKDTMEEEMTDVTNETWGNCEILVRYGQCHWDTCWPSLDIFLYITFKNQFSKCDQVLWERFWTSHLSYSRWNPNKMGYQKYQCEHTLVIRTDKRHLHKNPPLHAIACSLLYIFLSYIHTSPTALNQLLHAIGISLYQSSEETWALIAPIMPRSGKGWLSANAHCANCRHNDWGLEPHGIW